MFKVVQVVSVYQRRQAISAPTPISFFPLIYSIVGEGWKVRIFMVIRSKSSITDSTAPLICRKRNTSSISGSTHQGPPAWPPGSDPEYRQTTPNPLSEKNFRKSASWRLMVLHHATGQSSLMRAAKLCPSLTQRSASKPSGARAETAPKWVGGRPVTTPPV